ncbi:MAG: hypothetical protein JO353_09870 [Phycisphaerae bacterium]|nr:hypothetical protein [Phycisphaerae bacterium]
MKGEKMQKSIESKKQYAKPEVIQHGKVEELTHLVSVGGSSVPCIWGLKFLNV